MVNIQALAKQRRQSADSTSHRWQEGGEQSIRFVVRLVINRTLFYLLESANPAKLAKIEILLNVDVVKKLQLMNQIKTKRLF